ncbi:MAG: diguanylate cyclase [Candidatus Bipolaricaulis sp.]|nr:diguanylate cyclase [Candidatus Bipolaricaulis sp.]
MSKSGSGTEKLLLVASSPARARAAKEALAAAGYAVDVRRSWDDGGAKRACLALVMVARGETISEALDSGRLSQARSCPAVALVEEGDPAIGVAALSAGARTWLPYPLEAGQLVAVVRAVLGQAEADRATAETAEHTRDLIERVPVGVFETVHGRIVYVNEYLVSASGYTREELLGRRAEELVTPDDRGRAALALAERGQGVAADGARTYRMVEKGGVEHVVEISTRLLGGAESARVEGTVRDITREVRLRRLNRVVLELGEVILAEPNIDRILQLVLDTIAEYSGFRRAVLTLYDLSAPVALEGEAEKMLCSGLSPDDRKALFEQVPMSPAERRQAFDERFRLGPAYYIPHDEVPWNADRGLSGTVTLEGWHKDDMLFIPLRGTAGIIGSISVDDPIDQSVPTVSSIEPVASLANLAALAVEHVYKLDQLRRQKERLHSLSQFGRELANVQNLDALCDAAARRIRSDLAQDYCGIWMRDGRDLVLRGTASDGAFPRHEVPARGTRTSTDGEGLTRWAIDYVEPAIVPDVAQDPRYKESRASVRSMVAVPIIGKRRAVGAIDAESRRRAAFGEQDVEVLSTIAAQLSVAISALNRRDALARIYELGQRIAAATTVEQIVASTLDFLVEQFDYQLTSIFLQDRDERLSAAGVRGPYDSVGVASGWKLPEGKGIVSWVARNKRTAVVSDVYSDPRYLEGLPTTRAELAVPLLFGERLVGVLNIESDEAGFFDEEDRQLVEVIASHLATAISNLASQTTLREQAVRDPLTGLFNRHYFNSIIAPELNRGDRYARAFSVMMIDVDGFRAVNNRFGHLRGDEVLQQVAIFLNENVRASDRVIRYGGDEFLVFMPETVEEEANLVAERLRDRILLVPRRTGIGDLDVGLSIGIYTREPGDTRSLESLLTEVDRRMYSDKRSRHIDRADEYRS